ncbi:MAG: hypothetical protein ACD_43C00164G0002 [uncultured bacterium]|nr:MAG: hypothetical protein ACD_43C00164G0002 [uncultured bacterium]
MKSRIITTLAQPVKWTVAVPGSKSLMNRALLCAALATGRSILKYPVFCDDTNYMIAALRSLGVHIQRHAQTVTVFGCGGRFRAKTKKIYIGNAGTVMRFLTPFVPTGVQLIGNQRMQQRPLVDLQNAVQTLRQIGQKNNIKITGRVSSQFISALLMYAPTLRRTIIISVSDKIVSAPYIQMTIELMRRFGVNVQQRGRRFTIRPQKYRATKYEIEGDASSATYWWALAAITRSHITVTNVPVTSRQPDIRFLNIMRRMGCTVKGTTVVGPWNKPLKPIRLAMADCPDAVMSVAIVAALAPGISQINQIHHLVAKESNRLRALQLNLRRLGISARATTRALTIIGRNQVLWPATIKTHSDHRLAMAFAILGLACDGVSIDEPACVKKSYPTFWSDFTAAQRLAHKQHLIITGMRGVGKTTYGKALAQQLKRSFIDLDQAIEQRVHQSTAQYVKQYGWPAFREQEHLALQAVLKKPAGIIATGGGTLMYSRNQKLIQAHYVVLLTTPLSVIEQRLANQAQRPTLLPQSQSVKSELRTVWRLRKDKYFAVADAICRV